MNDKPIDILLLGGTSDARQVAHFLAVSFPELRSVISFAGIVQDLPDLPLERRVGGFGGVDGLRDFLARYRVRLIIDATHPFAAQMSWNATEAAASLSVPLVRLERSAWTAQEGDRWQPAANLEDACRFLESGTRAFLAIGRKEIERFYHRKDIFALARMIEAPPSPLPEGWHLELSRPAKTVDEEIELLRGHQIAIIVCKNSGGQRSYAKLEAARLLEIPVIMIERPDLPSVPTFKTPDGLIQTITQLVQAS